MVLVKEKKSLIWTRWGIRHVCAFKHMTSVGALLDTFGGIGHIGGKDTFLSVTYI